MATFASKSSGAFSRSGIDISFLPRFTGAVAIQNEAHLQIKSGFETQDYFGSLKYSAAGGISGTLTGVSYQNSLTGLSYSVSNFSADAGLAAALINSGQANTLVAQILKGDDQIGGTEKSDFLMGFAGNDKFTMSGGGDTIDGGPGSDTAIYNGARASFAVVRSSTAATVTGPSGTDTLYNIERLQFFDATLALDVAGNAGQAYRLYQAALNRTPDKPGLGAQIGGLDSGMPLLQIAQNFMDSPEFKLKYGANLSNSGFVTQLYSNVLHRAPDASGFAHQLGALDNNAASRAQLLVNFSESPENQAALIGVIQNGIEYQA